MMTRDDWPETDDEILDDIARTIFSTFTLEFLSSGTDAYLLAVRSLTPELSDKGILIADAYPNGHITFTVDTQQRAEYLRGRSLA